MPEPSFIIGVDVGGTFTDIFVLDEDRNSCEIVKVPSRPEDQSTGILDGISKVSKNFEDISLIIHGTTVGTNALLERKGAKTGIITTTGFRDVIEMRRRDRPHTWGLWGNFEPIIPRDLRLEVDERVLSNGVIEKPVNIDQVRNAAQQLIGKGVEAVCIFFMNSYANSANEKLALEAVQSVWPNDYITCASEILPEIREFERGSTSALNAYLQPIIGNYLERLGTGLAKGGLQGEVLIVQSNGGVMTIDVSRSFPVRTALSGPAAGVIAGAYIGKVSGYDNLITCDMGGTSFDVSLVSNGETALAPQTSVDFGLVVRTPMIEITTIGAGGGSLATTDDGQSLRVGPHSAGADPGPACYGRGGERPTVTDANCHLGRIDASHFLGGSMTLHPTVAARALEKEVAEPLGMDLDTAADGVLRVAVSHMASAIRLSLFEKGLDPADFALVSFGGASGLHACDTATDLNIRTVIFPRDPGTLSAWGMLWSDITHNISRSMLMPACDDAEHHLASVIVAMTEQGHESLAADGIGTSDHHIECELDLRYPGQAYEIAVPYRQAGGIGAALSAFHDAHQAQFSHCDETSPVDIVNVRMTAHGLLRKPAAAPAIASTKVAQPNLRQVYLDGTRRDLLVYERQHLPDDELIGPLIIEDPHSTLLIPTGWSLKLALAGEIIARYEGAEP